MNGFRTYMGLDIVPDASDVRRRRKVVLMTRSRKTAGLLGGAAALSLAGVASLGLPAGAAAPSAVAFAYTGAAQQYAVPGGVCSVTVEALGAQGGSGTFSTWTVMVAGGHLTFVIPDMGGLGAKTTSTIPVTPGESLQVDVGGKGDGRGLVEDSGGVESYPDGGVGGWNGGADGGTDPNQGTIAGGGGGASDVRQGGTSLADRVVVAGGGGGRGAGSGQSAAQADDGIGGNPATAGGDGSQEAADFVGNMEGGGFADPVPHGTGAGGGGAALAAIGGTGGTEGLVGDSVGTTGSDGGLGVGGHGATSTLSGSSDLGGFTGGGGGGGLYGGGGGGSGAYDSSVQIPMGYAWRVAGGGGGGGSSLGTTTAAGVHEGDGQVTVTPIAGACDASTPTTPTTTLEAASVAKAVDAKPTYTG